MKKFLSKQLWKLRFWAFKLIFGLELRSLISINQHFKLMSNQLDQMHKELRTVQEFSLEIVDLTGGPGWVHTMQNAVMQLDERLDQLRIVIIQHQDNFEAIADENEEIVSTSQLPKNQLN